MPLRLLPSVVLLVVALMVTAAAGAGHPNVVLIVSDDLGWHSLGYHGGIVSTPNIDRIAHEGVELDRFYVAPECSPTRAGLITGRYPIRFGMGRTVVHPWSNWGMPPEELTLPEGLAKGGFAERVIFGKWHLGHMDPRWLPLSNGFTEFTGCYTGEIDYFTHQRLGEVDWHHNFDDSDEHGYVTNLVADGCANFISSHGKDGPFFCYAAFTAPHTPWEAPEEYLKRFVDLDDNPADGKPSDKQTMAAMVACLDDGVGRILDSISHAGIADNTLVFYMNDNGGVMAFPGNNQPLRDGKFTVYEGGVRVPAAVWWPGHITGARKIETPLMNIDVMPTILKLSGVEAQSEAPRAFDGLDASSLLLDSSSKGSIKPRDMFFFCGEWGYDKEQVAVTDADGWKLIVSGPDVRRAGGCEAPGHRIELYRLSDDPYEQHDLADKEPSRVKEMSAKLVEFRNLAPHSKIPPNDKKPAGFKPPPHWHISPP